MSIFVLTINVMIYLREMITGMSKLGSIYLLLASLIFAGCTRGTDSLPELSEYPIRWDVDLEQGQDTRALMDATSLQSSCTEKTDGSNESISVWGQYTFGEQTMEEFENTPLTYGTTNAWDYENTRYWRRGAVYDFRTFYPRSRMDLMTEKNAACFKGRINTSIVQEDILVTALQVDTKTATLYSSVPLNMHHVFAAIKFKVKAIDGFTPADDDGITSCWLQNATGDTNLFSTSGTLEHTGNTTQNISWTKDASTTAPMYLWKHEGLGFATETAFYASNGNGVGSVYTQNDGWLLVIPQEVKSETLNFCFTRKKTGDKVYSVTIPAITYERENRYNYLLEINGASAELSLSIQPWNTKNFIHKVGVKNSVFIGKGTLAIENNAYIKHDSLYLIKNKQSDKYFYANPETKLVEARTLEVSNDGVIPSNYVWRLSKQSPLGQGDYRYFYIESMVDSDCYIQPTKASGDNVSLAPKNNYVTIRVLSNFLTLRDTGNRFFAVNGGMIYGTSGTSYATYATCLYEVTRQQTGLEFE